MSLWGQGSCGCDDCLLTLGHLEMSLPTIRRDLEEHLTCPVTSYIRKLRPRDIEGLLRDGGWVSTWQRQFKVVLVDLPRPLFPSWCGALPRNTADTYYVIHCSQNCFVASHSVGSIISRFISCRLRGCTSQSESRQANAYGNLFMLVWKCIFLY